MLDKNTYPINTLPLETQNEIIELFEQQKKEELEKIYNALSEVISKKNITIGEMREKIKELSKSKIRF